MSVTLGLSSGLNVSKLGTDALHVFTNLSLTNLFYTLVIIFWCYFFMLLLTNGILIIMHLLLSFVLFSISYFLINVRYLMVYCLWFYTCLVTIDVVIVGFFNVQFLSVQFSHCWRFSISSWLTSLLVTFCFILKTCYIVLGCDLGAN